ncbi:MAG TPA: hypothetical protein ENI05_01960 [Porticoccus sp.]|nr:hypothetical protein [Porticoccus sp.]
MKALIISLLLILVGGGFDGISAAITQRIIHAGDTPLFSDCGVTQTGPMELTVTPCTFTTTGEARIASRLNSVFALTGIGPVAQALREDKAEWHGNRVRAWLRDKQGNIIEKSVTWRLPTVEIIGVTPGETYFLYLIEDVGVTMEVLLIPVSSPRPAGYIHYLAFEFTVPLGTTNLSSVDIEVFTVRPDFPPAKGLFEK